MTVSVKPRVLTQRLASLVVAGLLALLPSLDSGMLIGLGGGGLVNFLHHIAPSCTLTAVELDPVVADIAQRYFGLDEPFMREFLTVRIGNGLEIDVEGIDAAEQMAIPAESLSFIVIDVDTKDSSVGMSCPPVSFLELNYLQRLAALMVPSAGVLAINVSARDPLLLEFACSRVAEIFSNVYISKQHNNDDINVVVLATHSEKPPAIDGSLKVDEDLLLIAQGITSWKETSQVGDKTGRKKKKSKSRGGKKR